MTHYTPINAWVPKNIVFVNQRMFNVLDADTQAAVLAAAGAAQTRGWEMSAAEATALTVALDENGIAVYEPSAELVEGLQAISAMMLDNWRANASASALAVLAAYQHKRRLTRRLATGGLPASETL